MTTASPYASGSSALRLTAVFAGGNLAATILRMLGGFLTAKVVEPSVLGLYASISLVLGYAPFLQLGVLNGLNRELPFYVGRGDQKRVMELAAAAKAWALLVGGLAALGLIAVAFCKAVNGQWELATGWSTNAVSVLLLFYVQYYLQATYRTRGDFARLAAINVVQAVLNVILVAVVWLFDFYGLCLRLLVTGLVNAFQMRHWRPLRLRPRWNSRHLVHLFKIGAPIFGVGQLYAWWTVLNNTLVLTFMGTRGLGLYTLAQMAGPVLSLLPQAISQVTYPRMAESYGRTGRVSDLLMLARKPILFGLPTVGSMVIVGWFAIPPVTRHLIPKYAEAIPAAQWSLLQAFLYCLMPVNNVFNIIRRQDLYASAIVIGMLIHGGILLLLVHKGVYLAAFSQSIVMGKTVFMVLCYFFVAILARRYKTESKHDNA
ncbi:MAG: lipopolysaccharide biosynthesis protein [Armatimonadetes bacterium]|nr:lipopolysaccharide biosynthesis protein [Armatimonadota bacterium]